MAVKLSDLRGSQETRPPQIVIYGGPGVGKTTLAAFAPDPVFIWTERGAGLLNPAGFPLATSYQDVIDAIGALYMEPHDFRSVVIDTLDELEPLIWRAVCEEHGVAGIESVMKGYGKGYLEAVRWWRRILTALDALRSERNMNVVLVSHCLIKRFEDPRTEPYDRYLLKLNDKAIALVYGSSDIVAFAGYPTSTTKVELGFNKTATRGIAIGERTLHLEERPAFLAKNRYGMPAEMPLHRDGNVTWQSFAQYIPRLNFPRVTEPAPDAQQQLVETAP